MSAADKIKNAAQDVAGKAKEAVGGLKDDDAMRAEGQKDQAAADAKQRGEHVKDAFKG
ncbi:CsbD family protein [Pseudokineococcus marinus]|uniref:CsbD family protein n=1 Tax=Pseudokineococcus marinus TaxID=351215 RepID=A0A849BLB8_9ACTN|nr:CsbD family protein [Pseudokineococcus marinus]NNH24069.1 CsbD family protein [Pseudokineococcus marinus]